MTARNQPHKYRCDWLEEARIQISENVILFHGERFVKAEVIDEIITNLKKDRSVCHASHSDTITLLQKEAEQRIEDVIAELERRFADNSDHIGDYALGARTEDDIILALLREKGE